MGGDFFSFYDYILYFVSMYYVSASKYKEKERKRLGLE